MFNFFKWLKKNIVNVVLLSTFFTGIGLIAYPSVSNWYNTFFFSNAIMGYAENVSAMDSEYVKNIWEKAEEYNRTVAVTGNDWNPDDKKIAAYKKELDIDDSGIMGFLSIDKIDVKLPIYHTTDEEVLQKGVGHMSGTSLPIGGQGSHCILSSHRGLPAAKLFTDLDKMAVGDIFLLNILDRTLAYEVDQIRIVEPSDFSFLNIVDGEDYCTLFTCTPYGINSHRLLVRGHRTKNPAGSAAVPSDAMQYEPVLIAPFFAAPILLLALAWLMMTTSSHNRLRRSRERALSEVLNGTGTVLSGAGSEAGSKAGSDSDVKVKSGAKGRKRRRSAEKKSSDGSGKT